MDFESIRKLVEPVDSKILLLVLDGLGGLPRNAGGPTALEAARTPNLDKLARKGTCGLHVPVAEGITPGSGPAHLGLFGYDPLQYRVGRGVLSALGIDFDMTKRDVAARGNFCTLDDQRRVKDRRAGRISTEKSQKLVEMLRQIEIPNATLHIETIKDYRFLLIIRGEDLDGQVTDTDPQDLDVTPEEPRSLSPQSDRTAEIVAQFVGQAEEILADQSPANGVLLRGFSKMPEWPPFGYIFGLRAAAVAQYPMYRGVARLVGMKPLEGDVSTSDGVDTVEQAWDENDFFFVHVKPIDSAGEDRDFPRKVSLIEEADAVVPDLMDLGPDVIIATGDHSSPALMGLHSWHPVPVLLASDVCRPDGVAHFGERACIGGGLGPRLPSTALMPLALANAGWLEKFGA